MYPMTGAKWEDLTEEEKKITAREMEVYAAMIDYMDEQISRILSWLEESGKMDNTLVVFMSDNGANGGSFSAYPGQTEEFINSFDNSLENIGLPNSLTDMGPNWATASMGPFRLFKSFTSEGGIISPCIIKLPKSLQNDEKMNKAFTHISDMMPTFLEIAGAVHPSQQNEAIPAMMGKSLLPLFNGEKELKFFPETNITFNRKFLPFHSNGMQFSATINGRKTNSVFYSIGGGFVVKEERKISKANKIIFYCTFPYPIETGKDLLILCNQLNKTISEVVFLS